MTGTINSRRRRIYRHFLKRNWRHMGRRQLKSLLSAGIMNFLVNNLCLDSNDYVVRFFKDFPGMAHAHIPTHISTRPSYRYSRNARFPGQKYGCNNLGYRGSQSILMEKPDTLFRIAFVGASTTQQAVIIPFFLPGIPGALVKCLGRSARPWHQISGYKRRKRGVGH